MTSTELTTLKNWIHSVHIVGAVPAPVAPAIPRGMTVDADPVFTAQAMRVLQVNCAGCHQSGSEGGITHIMEADHLVSTGLVTIGNPSLGRLTGSLSDRTMPVPKSQLSLGPADVQVVRSRISSMKLVAVNSAAFQIIFQFRSASAVTEPRALMQTYGTILSVQR